MGKRILHALSFNRLAPAQKIASSFLFVILCGAFLLMLPISNHDGKFFPFIDALFTATSATCVTGLVTAYTADQFNLFGQIVIIIMIQIGGLGLMTLMAVVISKLKNRITMHDKIAMKEMLNQDSVFNMRTFLSDILKYTALFEGIGMVLLAFVMIPEFGIGQGLFNSMFLSISAFCNAGFDNIGQVSLGNYIGNPLVNIVIMSLIVLGGVGFAVWFDIRDKIRPFLKHKITFKRMVRSLGLHTKLVLIITAILIFGGAILIFITECNNPQSMANLSLGDKIWASLFQSVTLRTAGFATMDLAGYHLSSKFMMIIWMFIGGSPGGTAGGIKTTTIAIFLIFIFRNLRGRDTTTLMKRSIDHYIVVRAMTIITINGITLITGIYFLTLFMPNIRLVDLVFEAASAMATVGLTLGITMSLNTAAKLVIILLMFVGRIGITTFLVSFTKHGGHKAGKSIVYPSGHIIVG